MRTTNIFNRNIRWIQTSIDMYFSDLFWCKYFDCFSFLLFFFFCWLNQWEYCLLWMFEWGQWIYDSSELHQSNDNLKRKSVIEFEVGYIMNILSICWSLKNKLRKKIFCTWKHYQISKKSRAQMLRSILIILHYMVHDNNYNGNFSSFLFISDLKKITYFQW